LCHNREFGGFAPRLANTVAESGVRTGEYGEKAADTGDWQEKNMAAHICQP
jgi:hypothetical protein